jgi:hypothetical protein
VRSFITNGAGGLRCSSHWSSFGGASLFAKREFSREGQHVDLPSKSRKGKLDCTAGLLVDISDKSLQGPRNGIWRTAANLLALRGRHGSQK